MRIKFKNVAIKLISLIVTILIGGLLFYYSNEIMKKEVELTGVNSWLFKYTWVQWLLPTAYYSIIAYPLFILIRLINKKRHKVIVQAILGLGVYFIVIMIANLFSYFPSFTDPYVIKNILIFSFLGFLTPFLEYILSRILLGGNEKLN